MHNSTYMAAFGQNENILPTTRLAANPMTTPNARRRATTERANLEFSKSYNRLLILSRGTVPASLHIRTIVDWLGICVFY